MRRDQRLKKAVANKRQGLLPSEEYKEHDFLFIAEMS